MYIYSNPNYRLQFKILLFSFFLQNVQVQSSEIASHLFRKDSKEVQNLELKLR